MEVIEPEARERRLVELLKKYHSSRKNRVLVFVLYKKEASRVEERLQRAGWKVLTHFWSEFAFIAPQAQRHENMPHNRPLKKHSICARCFSDPAAQIGALW